MSTKYISSDWYITTLEFDYDKTMKVAELANQKIGESMGLKFYVRWDTTEIRAFTTRKPEAITRVLNYSQAWITGLVDAMVQYGLI